MPSDAERAGFISPAATTPERRKQKRFPCTAVAEVLDPISTVKVTGRTSDLSAGGCYVDTISPFPRGTLVSVRLLRDSERFEAKAKVAYSQVGMGMGLSFLSAEKEHVRTYQRWMRELTSGVPLEMPAPREEPPPRAINAEPQRTANAGANAQPQSEIWYVLYELVLTLMRKGVLSEAEGKAMLGKLTR